jgi:hypothetical protein
MEIKKRRDFIKYCTLGSAFAGIAGGLNGLFPRRVYSEESDKSNRIVYRDLGSTGFNVTEIGFGTMNTRDAELIQAAIDKGINYIDTAHSYMNGVNEEIVGSVMKTKRN